jgi:hypothetical protein
MVSSTSTRVECSCFYELGARDLATAEASVSRGSGASFGIVRRVGAIGTADEERHAH